MPLEPELEAIFNQDPRFAQVMAEYERGGTSNADPLRADPEHGGLTDEAIQTYLDRFYPPRNPEFRAGTGIAKPPTNQFEDGLSGDGTGTGSAPAPDPSQQQPAGDLPVTPPVAAPSGEGAPGSPDPRAATPPDPSAPGGQQQPPDPFRPDSQVDPRALAAWQDFDRQLRQDPRLQQILLHYSTTGRIPTELLEPASSPVFQAPTPPDGLDLDDPAVRLLWNDHVDAQRKQFLMENKFNEELTRVNQRVDQTSAEYQARVEAENQGLVDRAVASFARERGLDSNEVSRIVSIAENLGVVAHYMSGVDPITQLPVRPDPMAAVARGLEIAFNQDPIAQERERQRWMAAERARLQTDQQRRRNLAGVGGGSGQQPRQVTEPQTREDRSAAAVEYLRGIMNGTPEGQQ